MSARGANSTSASAKYLSIMADERLKTSSQRRSELIQLQSLVRKRRSDVANNTTERRQQRGLNLATHEAAFLAGGLDCLPTLVPIKPVDTIQTRLDAARARRLQVIGKYTETHDLLRRPMDLEFGSKNPSAPSVTGHGEVIKRCSKPCEYAARSQNTHNRIFPDNTTKWQPRVAKAKWMLENHEFNIITHREAVCPVK